MRRCLKGIIPFGGQADHWDKDYRRRYFNILKEADEIIILQNRYTGSCIFKRNRFMVDLSAHVIAVFNGIRCGIKYTLDYAQKKGLDIVVINPDELSSGATKDY
jgi:uncharacterized phage-like protein YoqJ